MYIKGAVKNALKETATERNALGGSLVIAFIFASLFLGYTNQTTHFTWLITDHLLK